MAGADKHKLAGECYRRGNEALAAENWAYSVQMFGQCVRLVPDNVMYRQILRGAEYRLYNNNKTGKRMAGMKLMKINGAIKKARKQSDWAAMDQAAEEGLAVNPWDKHLNAAVGEACEKLMYSSVAIFGYLKAVEADPADKELNRSLALLYEEKGEYAEAIKCWERIRKMDPLDSEARSKITQIEAESVMDRGGYEGAKTTQDVKSGYDHYRPPSGGAAADEHAAPGESDEADLKHAIRRDPENPNHYMKLADYYRLQKQLGDAAEAMRTALQLSGNDANIREQLEDIELEHLRNNLELAREAAQKNSEDQQARKNVVGLSRELLNREIEILTARVERYPADLKLKYQLAKLFMSRKAWDQAIPLLQAAGADSRQKAEVLVQLGTCFVQVNQPKVARRQVELALPSINHLDNPKLYTRAKYLCGYLCEKAGDTETAESHYTDILAVDYNYKDVRDRLERIQSGSE